MNVVFISPNFPEHFYNFCDRLKRLGVNVLGIGDCPYDSLDRRCVDALTEYYWTPSLEDYAAVYRAVAYYVFHYGRIDHIESQNEYWLGLEARLREDYNVATGLRPDELKDLQRKSKMKAHYAAAGIKTARWTLVEDLDELRRFARVVGRPIVVKPDAGVGAIGARKICNDAELVQFWKEKDSVEYIAEEYVPGRVETFDGIVDGRGDVIFGSGQVMLVNPMETSQGDGEATSYATDVKGTGLYEIGTRAAKAFGLKSRFFHLEFFRLLEDVPGLGVKGEVLGLEANLRAPGGYIPDKINYAHDVDVYQIWAEMLVYGENRSFADWRFKRYATHIGRSAAVNYAHSVEEVRAKYRDRLLFDKTPPQALNATMGAWIVLLKANSIDELLAQRDFILARAPQPLSK